MKDFMVKHPIITMLMFSDLCVLVNNVVCYITKGGNGDRGFTRTAIKDCSKEIAKEIKKDKDNKTVEIGFHK